MPSISPSLPYPIQSRLHQYGQRQIRTRRRVSHPKLDVELRGPLLRIANRRTNAHRRAAVKVSDIGFGGRPAVGTHPIIRRYRGRRHGAQRRQVMQDAGDEMIAEQ